MEIYQRGNQIKRLCQSQILTPSTLRKEDMQHLGEKKTRTYGCKICQKSGHRYKMCPTVIDYGSPLDLKNREQRDNLSERLCTLKGDICFRKENDQREIMLSVPDKVIGVIIHARFWKKMVALFLKILVIFV